MSFKFWTFYDEKVFKLNESYEVDQKIIKFDIIRYSTAETARIITPNGQMKTRILKEDSVSYLLTSYLDLNYKDNKKADNNIYMVKLKKFLEL